MKNTKQLFLLACLLFSQAFFSFGQQAPFLKQLQPSEITLTTEENTFYQSHLNSSVNSSVIITEVGNLSNYLENQLLTFTIPGTSTSLTVQPEYIESKSATDYSWTGVANGSGYFSITNNAGFYSGFIQTDNGAWTILPLRENISLLLKHNEAALGVLDCAVVGGEGFSGGADNCAEAYNTCPAVIDVLLFFTNGARDLATGAMGDPPFSLTMDAFVKALENSVNAAFTQSDIPNKKVRFRWVVYNPPYASTNNVENLVDNFSADPTANQMMADLRADLGIFISHVAFTDGAGFAKIKIEENPGPAHRHAAATFGALLAPRWTVAHELTHLLGAQHNWCNNVPCNTPNCACSQRDFCGHGYRFTAGGVERKTIHAIPNTVGSARILHFSNPDVNFLGASTGVNGEEPANNARIIRNTGCMVSGYAPSPEVSAVIGGQTLLCGLDGVFTPKIYTAYITQPAFGFPGTPPYTIAWWWNTSGIFTYQSPDVFLGNGNQVTINQVLNCDFFFLHVRVQSADGVVFTSTRVIKAHLCSDCTGERISGVNAFPTANASILKLYPNPNSGEFFVELTTEMGMTTNFTLSSLDGKIQQDLGKFNLSRGTNKIPFTLDNLPDGLYMLHFNDHSQRHSLLVSFQKTEK